jgi:hypothetical protein
LPPKAMFATLRYTTSCGASRRMGSPIQPGTRERPLFHHVDWYGSWCGTCGIALDWIYDNTAVV